MSKGFEKVGDFFEDNWENGNIQKGLLAAGTLASGGMLGLGLATGSLAGMGLVTGSLGFASGAVNSFEVFSGNQIGNGTFSRFLGAAAAVTGGFYGATKFNGIGRGLSRASGLISGYEIATGSTIGDGTLSSLFHVTNLGVNQGSTLFDANASAAQRFGVGLNLAVGGASVVSSGDRGLQQALRALSIANGVWSTGTQAVTAYQASKATMEALRPTPIQVRAGGSGFYAVPPEKLPSVSRGKSSLQRQYEAQQARKNQTPLDARVAEFEAYLAQQELAQQPVSRDLSGYDWYKAPRPGWEGYFDEFSNWTNSLVQPLRDGSDAVNASLDENMRIPFDTWNRNVADPWLEDTFAPLNGFAHGMQRGAYVIGDAVTFGNDPEIHAKAQYYRQEAIDHGDYISSAGYVSGIAGVRTLQAVGIGYVMTPMAAFAAPSFAAVPGASLAVQGLGFYAGEELARHNATASYYAYKNGDYLEAQDFGMDAFESTIDVGLGIHTFRSALLSSAPNGVASELWSPTGRFDTLVRSSGDFGRDLSAWNLNRFRNNSTRFYHGTTESFAADLHSGLIDPTYGRSNLDFGQGFYVSTSSKHAETMAIRTGRRLGEASSVVSYRVSNKELAGLNSQIFVAPDSDWTSFVRFNRTAGAPLHGFDMVSGPAVGNLSTFEPLPFPMYNQTSIHTIRGAEIFDGGIKRILR